MAEFFYLKESSSIIGRIRSTVKRESSIEKSTHPPRPKRFYGCFGFRFHAVPDDLSWKEKHRSCELPGLDHNHWHISDRNYSSYGQGWERYHACILSVGLLGYAARLLSRCPEYLPAKQKKGYLPEATLWTDDRIQDIPVYRFVFIYFILVFADISAGFLIGLTKTDISVKLKDIGHEE